MRIHMIKILVISLLVAGITGCTVSTPVETIGSYKGLKNTNPKKATIYVYRESSFAGATNQYDVMVNEKLTGSLPNGSFFSVDVDPGETTVKPRTLTDFKLGKGSALTVEKGKAYCLKLTINFCFGCKSADIDTIDLQQCDSEMKSLEKVKL